MLKLWVVLSVVLAVSAAPIADYGSFIGDSTCELAAALLQGHRAQNENMVHSPFGYNTLLALFAEGANGTSRDELVSALHLPEDINVVRETYQNILKELTERNKFNTPEMKNWFYIYKNFSVNENLKSVLRQYYLTEVKSVDRLEEFKEKKEQTKVKVPSGLQGKPTDHLIDVDKEVESIIESATSPHKSDGEEASSNNQALMFDPSQKKDEKVVVNATEEIVTENSNIIKKEEVIQADDKVEKLPGANNNNEKIQVIEEDKLKEEVNDKKEAPVLILKEEDEKVKDVVKEPENVEKNKEDTDESYEKNQVDKDDKEELMVAMQRSSGEDDMTGLTDSTLTVKGTEPRSEMIVFNGLYFNGEWENEFIKRKADDARPFKKSSKEQIFVSTIQSEGAFNTAEIPEINSRAIELKYKGGRYSLLLVVPNDVDGLDKLVADISNYPLKKICQQLTEKQVDLCLPTFEIMTISKPVPASEKLAISRVKSIFDPNTADLSGIAEGKGLFVEDLVQAVGFEVDSTYSEANFLSASIASSRSDVDVEEFKINRPFLFFLCDTSNGIVIVNGKIVDPTPTAEDIKSKFKTFM